MRKQMRKHHYAPAEWHVLSVAIFAAILSLMFKYVLTMVSSGFAIIISGAGASALGAMLFKDEEGAEEE